MFRRRRRPRRWGRWIAAALALPLATFALAYRSDLPSSELEAKYTGETSRFLEVGGQRVHYRDEGEGPALVLVHGTFSSLHTWDAWTERLAKDFRVIRLDLPGHGLTGPTAQGDYSTLGMAVFVDSFTRALGLERFHLAGNSLGGQIAWHMAALHPERVDRLVLLNAAGYPRDKVPSIFRIGRLPLIGGLLLRCTPRALIERNLRQVYADPDRIDPELVTRLQELARREGNRTALLGRIRQAVPSDMTLLSRINSPTLVLWGQQDGWIPVTDGEAYARDIANARLVVLEQSGHVPMEEHPEESLLPVLEFLLQRAEAPSVQLEAAD